MKAAVITFPGSNCDDDCAFVLEKICEFKVDRLWHKETPLLSDYDLIALPGGFSYGDYLRCGAIASLSPIMENVIEHARNGGLVLGICNGFQLLCETRLLPGALAKNSHLQFVCQDVFVRVAATNSPWTGTLKEGETLKLPIAHGDGRYIVDEAEYNRMRENGQILLTYCNTDGKETPNSNPNGSCFSIAGVCNAEKNVFGLMPHPERAADLRGGDGKKLLSSLLTWIHEKKT